MNELIVCLIKYTTIFACFLYAFTRLLHIKLKAWDLLDIPLFIAISAVLYFLTVYIKILVPIGLLIFGVAFLFLRFRETFYKTVTVGTIALGISIVLYLVSFFFASMFSMVFNNIQDEIKKYMLSQVIVSIFQIACVFLVFKIKRFKSGIDPKITNPTFEIMLHLSVGTIIAMMLLYIKNITQSMLEISLIISVLFALLIILWWRRHITYNYREAVNQQNFNRMEDTIEEYEINSVENELRLAVLANLFHYLNKAVPNCALLAESAAAKTNCQDACAVRDMLQIIMRKLKLAYEKCGLQNIPQTGIRLVDAPIIQLFAAAERKNFNVSADFYVDVKSWFSENEIDIDDIHTLLNYLCDNAVISALGLPNAKVRVELGATANQEPLIRIYDSGEQFAEEVLAKLGLEQVTTRAFDGGNGIGLFTVFKILAKYGASFALDEAPQSFGFTKFIEIAFDKRRSVCVRTYRESVVAVCAARKGITVELIISEEETLRDGTNG